MFINCGFCFSTRSNDYLLNVSINNRIFVLLVLQVLCHHVTCQYTVKNICSDFPSELKLIAIQSLLIKISKSSVEMDVDDLIEVSAAKFSSHSLELHGKHFSSCWYFIYSLNTFTKTNTEGFTMTNFNKFLWNFDKQQMWKWTIEVYSNVWINFYLFRLHI